MTSIPTGMKCRRCGKEVKSGLVFLCGPRAWVPFCTKCLYHSKNRIAVAIAATGLEEAELAENMKVSVSSIRSWRSGKVKKPKRENLENLAALAGVSMGWLEGKEDKPQKD
jgi:hypothetical protein